MNQIVAVQEARPLKADDFLRGQCDCRDGTPHRSGQSDSYDRGYAAQYEAEQRMSARSKQ